MDCWNGTAFHDEDDGPVLGDEDVAVWTRRESGMKCRESNVFREASHVSRTSEPDIRHEDLDMIASTSGEEDIVSRKGRRVDGSGVYAPSRETMPLAIITNVDVQITNDLLIQDTHIIDFRGIWRGEEVARLARGEAQRKRGKGNKRSAKDSVIQVLIVDLRGRSKRASTCSNSSRVQNKAAQSGSCLETWKH